jgi:hypothetical protein
LNAPRGADIAPGFVYLVDANGRKIGSLWGSSKEKLASAQTICRGVELAVAVELGVTQGATNEPAHG